MFSNRIGKRKKKACALCRKNHLSCDSGRPCGRCVRRGHPHLCVDAASRQEPPVMSNRFLPAYLDDYRESTNKIGQDNMAISSHSTDCDSKTSTLSNSLSHLSAFASAKQPPPVTATTPSISVSVVPLTRTTSPNTSSPALASSSSVQHTPMPPVAHPLGSITFSLSSMSNSNFPLESTSASSMSLIHNASTVSTESKQEVYPPQHLTEPVVHRSPESNPSPPNTNESTDYFVSSSSGCNSVPSSSPLCFLPRSHSRESFISPSNHSLDFFQSVFHSEVDPEMAFAEDFSLMHPLAKDVSSEDFYPSFGNSPAHFFSRDSPSCSQSPWFDSASSSSSVATVTSSHSSSSSSFVIPSSSSSHTMSSPAIYSFSYPAINLPLSPAISSKSSGAQSSSVPTLSLTPASQSTSEVVSTPSLSVLSSSNPTTISNPNSNPSPNPGLPPPPPPHPTSTPTAPVVPLISVSLQRKSVNDSYSLAGFVTGFLCSSLGRYLSHFLELLAQSGSSTAVADYLSTHPVPLVWKMFLLKIHDILNQLADGADLQQRMLREVLNYYSRVLARLPNADAMYISLSEKRRQRLNFYAKQYEKSTEPIILTVEGMRIVYCNSKFQQMVGKVREEGSQQDWRIFEFLHPEDIIPFTTTFYNLLYPTTDESPLTRVRSRVALSAETGRLSGARLHLSPKFADCIATISFIFERNEEESLPLFGVVTFCRFDDLFAQRN